MKRIAFIIIFLYTLVSSVSAQEPRFIFDRDSTNTEVAPAPKPQKQSAKKSVNDSIAGDSLSKVPPAIPAWKIDARFGERIPVVMDTLFLNYHQETLVDGQGVAMGYLGNWGSPAQSKIFFERGETSQFYFLDAFNYCYKKPEDQVFLDTKQPYSNFSYQSGGGSRSKEERFTGEMSLSFNKKFSIGFDVDYVYSRGVYSNLSNKQINYDLFASYKTEKYQMHIFVANNNYTNLENGGLKSLDADFVKAKAEDLETNMYETWNRLRGRRLYMTHKYTVGYDDDKTETFIPVASAFLTTNYTDQRRKFNSRQVEILDDSIYNFVKNSDYNLDSNGLNDRMSYYSIKNTFGISLNEGFREWVKFGLTAFVEQDFRNYALPGVNYTSLSSETDNNQSSTVIGGVLSKEKGEFLRYNLSADLGVLGYNIGESRIQADVTTQFNAFGKPAVVKANGYIKNLKPTFFENRYMSRYYRWEDNDFSDIRRVFVGGEIYFPFTKTRLSGGVETLNNYIYYTKQTDLRDDKGKLIENYPVMIKQADENVQVISLRLDQKMNVGILHWDNQLVYQTSTKEEIIPLPKLSGYTNLYIQTKLAKVLDVQLGVDAHFHTRYYAPAYDPALLQFYNQNKTQIGNFPIATAYANFHLKKTRFFVMMYNVAQSFRDSRYYSLPDYLVNPMGFKFGLSWNFTD